MYFSFADKEVIVEAKMEWLYLHKNLKKDFGDKINPSLRKAEKDIKVTMSANKADHGHAISCLTPYWKSEFN